MNARSPRGPQRRDGERIVLTRRRLFGLTLLAGSTPLRSLAQPDYPTRPITLLVPYAAGGGTDLLARQLAAHLARALGQPITVENRPGANGAIGLNKLLQQAADGYTLLLGSHSTHVIAPLESAERHAVAQMQSDFSILSIIAQAPLVLAVRADTGPRDLAEFMAQAKSRPVSFGTFGVGSSGHVMGETLSRSAQLKMLHVPYKGSAAALTDLLGGHVESVFLTPAALIATVQAGAVRPLALTGHARLPTLAATPTFVELGLPQMADAGWFALFARHDTPTPIAEKVSLAIQQVLREKALRDVLLQEGLTPVGNSAAEALATWQSSLALAQTVVREAGDLQ